MAARLTANEDERRILGEIDGVADRLRGLRSDSVRNEAAIKSLTADLRTKWEQLRALRAGPVVDPGPQRGHYR